MKDKNVDTLRKFVRETLSEGAYFEKPSKDSRLGGKGLGLWDKIKSMFTGGSGGDPSHIAKEWLEDQELIYDFEFPKKLIADVYDFTASKWEVAMRKSDGDEERAASVLKRALDMRFKSILRDMDRKNSRSYEEDF